MILSSTSLSLQRVTVLISFREITSNHHQFLPKPFWTQRSVLVLSPWRVVFSMTYILVFFQRGNWYALVLYPTSLYYSFVECFVILSLIYLPLLFICLLCKNGVLGYQCGSAFCEPQLVSSTLL